MVFLVLYFWQAFPAALGTHEIEELSVLSCVCLLPWGVCKSFPYQEEIHREYETGLL